MGYLFLSDQYSYNDQTFVWAHSLRLSSQTQPFIADSITIIPNYLSSEILSSIENVLGKHTGKKKSTPLKTSFWNQYHGLYNQGCNMVTQPNFQEY